MSKTTIALAVVAMSLGTTAYAQKTVHRDELISKTQDRYKDVKPKSKWTGNTGFYYQREKEHTFEGHYPFMSGNFRRSQSRWSFNYLILKKYSGSGSTLERTRLQGGVKYKATQSWGNFATGLAYRNQIEGSEGATFERTRAWRPSASAKVNLGDFNVFTNLNFSFENKQVSGNAGGHKTHYDYDNVYVAGAGYKFNKSNSLTVDYRYDHERFTGKEETEGLIRAKYKHTLSNGVSVAPFFWYGLGQEIENASGEKQKEVDSMAYGFSYSHPLHQRLTFVFTGYMQELDSKDSTGSTAANTYERRLIDTTFGINYAY